MPEFLRQVLSEDFERRDDLPRPVPEIEYVGEPLRQLAQSVNQQAVVARLMPMNNPTGMTEEERALLKVWFEAGAK